MFQKFNQDTLGSSFIKSLLAQTPIPLFDAAVDGDQIVEGCYYVYKKFIIRCVLSGLLRLSKSEILYVSDTVYPTEFLFAGYGVQTAKFYVVGCVDTYDPKCFSTYVSSTNYYDSETHYHLGRYLRYLRTTTGLNLMPYYNCYTSQMLSDVELYRPNAEENITQRVKIDRTSKQRYKLIAVPILFGKTYTIAIDCSTEVFMRACLYDKSGFITESTDTSFLTPSMIAALGNSGVIHSCCRFDSPVTFKIETADRSFMQLEKNLYLLIQLPATNTSSIVVLEDYVDTKGVRCNENSVREPSLVNPSLLRGNTDESYAFSDRLIEYLLGNVIHRDDVINENIAKIQTSLASTNTSYYRAFLLDKLRKGVWDENIPRLVSILVEEYAKDNIVFDQDGNVNKDVESILWKKGQLY